MNRFSHTSDKLLHVLDLTKTSNKCCGDSLTTNVLIMISGSMELTLPTTPKTKWRLALKDRIWDAMLNELGHSCQPCSCSVDLTSHFISATQTLLSFHCSRSWNCHEPSEISCDFAWHSWLWNINHRLAMSEHKACRPGDNTECGYCASVKTDIMCVSISIK